MTKTHLELLPTKLSPSRAKDFVTCPKKFFHKTIEKRREPNTVENTRGTIAHDALEQLYRLPREQRTVDAAVEFIKPAWDKIKGQDTYKHLDTDEQATEMLEFAEECVRNFFTIEDPTRFDPTGIEFHAKADLDSGLTLHGYIDRMDEVPAGEESRTYLSDYKGLALDTPIPTPDGWTTMGELQVGDRVFGRSGVPVTVTAKSEIHHRPCYRLTVGDGSSVVADNVHLWRVNSVRHKYMCVMKNGNVQRSGAQPPQESVVSTEEVAKIAQELGPSSLYIDTHEAVELPPKDLPIDPWVLGAWLGDGNSTAGQLTIGSKDFDQMSELVSQHWGPHSRRKDRTSMAVTLLKRSGVPLATTPQTGSSRGTCCLRRLLREEGLLGHKHIPSSYLRGSIEQRTQLLRGLMDTDGHWHQSRRRAVFVTTSPELAEAFVDLVRSLGVSPQVFEKDYENAVRPDARVHMIEFRPIFFNPFSLPRKADLVDEHLKTVKLTRGPAPAAALRRTIKSVEAVQSVPTQCIQVDAEDSMYLAGRGFIPTHNTSRKIPSPRYLSDTFFAMRIYALLIREMTGKAPHALRLVFIKHTGAKAVKTEYVTDEMLDRTRREIDGIWTRIRSAAAKEEWPAKTGPLCNWCHFQSECPDGMTMKK